MLLIVDPAGQIVPQVAPFSYVGNRGGRIHENRKLTRRRWTSDSWLICVTNALTDPDEFIGEKGVTDLFFLDEPTALAAGHRPCWRCNRDRYDAFLDAFRVANERPTADYSEMDGILHGARLDDAKKKRTWATGLDELPDGVIVRLEPQGQPHLIHAGGLYPWSSHGYGVRIPSPGGSVEVLTPEPTVKTMVQGYDVGPLRPLLAW